MSRISRALRSRSYHGPWILAAALLVALLVAPFAGAFGEGNAVRGGARNPSSDASKSYTKETQIIANLSTYGTRQSNKSNNGGGAVYGCRSGPGGSAKGNEPCIRATNLSTGYAFEFNTNSGTQVGLITGPTNSAPFTTTATGVATGLNADKVDGQDASDIVASAQAQNKFAAVSVAGVLGGNRGATAASLASPATFSVTFNADVSACARTATITGATPGEITTTSAGGANVAVNTFNSSGTATPLPFDLVVTC